MESDKEEEEQEEEQPPVVNESIVETKEVTQGLIESFGMFKKKLL